MGNTDYPVYVPNIRDIIHDNMVMFSNIFLYTNVNVLQTLFTVNSKK